MINPESDSLNDLSPDSSADKNMSARKKALLLARVIGLASEGDYRPADSSVADRALYRQRKLLSQYQANLETIFSMALTHTPSDVTGSDLDVDWSHQFFQMAEQIHGRKMQELWAKILASEIVKPGNYSLRTLATLKQLTLREAIILEKALGMCVRLNQEPRLKLLNCYKLTGGVKQYFRKNTLISMGLSQFGMPYSSVLTLIEAGILYSSEFETGLLEARSPITLTLSDSQIRLTPKQGHLLFNYYRFTPIGDELCSLITPKQDLEYSNHLSQVLKTDFRVET
jgi:uncharacterized repeat protein (TIGR03899 family)